MGSFRRIIRRSPKRTIGAFCYQAKSDEDLAWESTLERDMLYLLGFFPSILKLSTQSVELNYLDEEQIERVAYPDILAQTIFGETIFEVKSDFAVSDSEELRRLRQVAARARETGRQYYLMTESVIRLQPRLSIVKLVLRYRHFPVHDRHHALLAALAAEKPEWQLQDMVERFQAAGLETVYALIACGRIRLDLSKPLTPMSLLYPVSSPDQQASHLELLANNLLERELK